MFELNMFCYRKGQTIRYQGKFNVEKKTKERIEEFKCGTEWENRGIEMGWGGELSPDD